MRFFLRLVLAALILAPFLSRAQVVMHRVDGDAGQYLLSFDGGVPRLDIDPARAMAAAREQLQSRIEQLEKDLDGTDLVILRRLWIRNSIAIRLSSRYLSRLGSLDYVTGVRADVRYRAEPQGVVQLPQSGEWVQQNLTLLEIDSLWAEGYRGQGVVVAVLDTGVDLQHEDLRDRWRGGSNSWFDPYGEQALPKDTDPRDGGHGTAVTSLILGGDATGSHVGVAPHAEWIAARIFDNSGQSSESAIAEALQWLLDPDNDPATDDYPDIVHNSWGLAGTEGSCDNPFRNELEALAALGIDIVFAIGNSGPSSSGKPTYLTPAFDPHVISVGAVESDGANIWYESSRGPDVCGSAVIPFVVAPGQKIKAAAQTFGLDFSSSRVFDGTSFSAPQVSGILALLRSRFSVASADLLDALAATARDLGVSGIDADFGHGLARAWPAAQRLAERQTPSMPAEVNFNLAKLVVSEGEGLVRVVVTRSGDLSAEASILLSTRDGTAKEGEDFVAQQLTLNFLPGESRKSVEIVLVDDAVEESDESFAVDLYGNVHVNMGPLRQKEIRITDNDSSVQEDEIGGAAFGWGMLLMLGLLGAFRRRW